MKNVILFFLASCLVITSAKAQDEEGEPRKGFDKSRLFFGGNFGASFGGYTFVNLTPQLGYRLSDYFAAGAGVNFIYSSNKLKDYNNNVVYKEEYGVTGLNIFGRVYPIQQVMIQLQPEMNYVWSKVNNYDGQGNIRQTPKFIPALLLGGGAAIPTGGGAFTVMLQYDLLQNGYPYGNRPFLSFGYSMGF